MIADFGKLSTNILFFVIYADSDSLATFVKDRLKERFNVDRRFIIDVATSKQLHEARLESFMRPLSGSKKMFNINADKMSKKDITNAFTIASSFSSTSSAKSLSIHSMPDLSATKNFILNIFLPPF